MPFKLRGNSVIKKTTGKTVPGGHHKTHAEALAHLRAIEMHVHDKANLDSMSPEKRKAFVATVKAFLKALV